MKERLVFVGAGRVGLALGEALRRTGEVAEMVYCGRHPSPPNVPLFDAPGVRWVHGLERPGAGTTALLLTVPDSAIAEVAHDVAALGPAPEGCVALHCSGALAVDALEPLHRQGYPVGSLHPLLSIADPRIGADRLEGVAAAVAGEAEALLVARRLIRALGMRELAIGASRRPLYHASAVLASNALLALVEVSRRLLEEAAGGAEDGVAALLPLIRSTLENMEASGAERALTGPIVRGDVETVALHLRVLDDPVLRELYRTLGRATLALGSERVPRSAIEAMEELLASEPPVSAPVLTGSTAGTLPLSPLRTHDE